MTVVGSLCVCFVLAFLSSFCVLAHTFECVGPCDPREHFRTNPTEETSTVSTTEQELRERCCSQNLHRSYCTDKKCYFVIKEELPFLTSRNHCRKDYVRWEHLVDAATFESREELSSILDVLPIYNLSWFGGIRCPITTPPMITLPTSSGIKWRQRPVDNYVPGQRPASSPHDTISYNVTWLNGKPIDWIALDYLEGPAEDCKYAATSYAMKDLRLNVEFLLGQENHSILCDLNVPNTTNPENTTRQTETTISSTTFDQPSNTSWCKNRTYEGMKWPCTPGGKNATADCPVGTTGKAIWECDAKTGEFVREPNMKGCKSEWVQDIEDMILNKGDPSDIANLLAQKTREEDLQYGDLQAIIKAIETLNMRYDDQHPTIKDGSRFRNATIQVSSNLLEERQTSSWENLDKSSRVTAANDLLLQIRTIGKMLSCGNEEEESITSSNIHVRSYVFRTKGSRVFPTAANQTNFLRVPSGQNVEFSHGKCSSLPTGFGVLSDRINSYLLDKRRANSRIISKVISFAYGSGDRTVNLPSDEPVQIFLQHEPIDETKKESSCVFWNFTELQWDDTGCWKVRGNSTHTECECSHLTTFAVLMDLRGDIRRLEDPVLKYLSIVCCALSSVALSFTMACLIGFRACHNRRSAITCNLSFCLLVVNLLVLFGIKRTENKIVCRGIAALLHYSALASFFWMLLEGYHLYQMVIVVFERINHIKLRWLCLSAYGLPLLIVLPTAIAIPKSYGDGHVCWLSAHDNAIWAFAGPVALILLANTTILIMALQAARRVKMKREQTKAKKFLGWIKGSFSLMSLLGITWIIGFLNAYKDIPTLTYAFTVLNGLQGSFIMIFHVIINEKVRGCFVAFIRRSTVSETKFRKSTQTTTSSRNPLYSGRGSESLKEPPIHFSSPKRISVSPASVTYTGHM